MMNLSPLRSGLAAVALTAAGLVAAPAWAGPYSQLVVFGDSLSDNGNNAAAGLFDPGQVITGNSYVPGSTYAPAGTYSNGPVWASYFAAAIGVPLSPSLLGGTDYAFGGATTGSPGVGPGGFPYSLVTQSSMYLATTANHAAADGLYVIAGGGNNARAALAAIGAGANAASTVATTAASFASDVGSIVDALQAAGAQHIVVWDTPNLGLAPALASSGAAAIGSFVSGAMNTALTARLAGEAGVSIFDIYGLGSQLAASFGNTTDACGAVANANCTQYVYWDGIHPTTAAHRVIANALLAVTAVPEPETWALMVVGLGVLGSAVRRRARTAPRA